MSYKMSVKNFNCQDYSIKINSKVSCILCAREGKQLMAGILKDNNFSQTPIFPLFGSVVPSYLILVRKQSFAWIIKSLVVVT